MVAALASKVAATASQDAVLSGAKRYGIALRRATFGILPIVITLEVIVYCARLHVVGLDFHYEFWPAGRQLLRGLSPYDIPQNISGGVGFPYPAVAAFLFAPFALIPHAVADWLFTAINMAAVVGGLWALNVRDRRVYGAAFLAAPVVSGWQTANVTLLLVMALAMAWRYRERPIVTGLLIALAISVKPFVWPLALWLLATRRYAALGYAVVCGAVLNAIAWGVLGFDQVHTYIRVLNAVTGAMYRRGYTLVAFMLHLGAGHSLALALAIGVAAAAGVACVWCGRRGNDRSSLSLAVATCLLATPVLWVHYFALTLVPLALARPRLTTAWLLPMVLWFCPISPATWQITLAIVVNLTIFAIALGAKPPAFLRRREQRSPLATPAFSPAGLPVGTGSAIAAHSAGEPTSARRHHAG
jgi:hypothetical protein